MLYHEFKPNFVVFQVGMVSIMETDVLIVLICYFDLLGFSYAHLRHHIMDS